MFFDTMYRMELQFRIKNIAILASRCLCYIWDITTYYDTTTRGGQLQMDWSASRRICAQTQTYWFSSPLSSQLLVSGGVCVVSVLALFLTFRAIFRSITLYLASKKRFHESARSYWHTLSIQKKLRVIVGFVDLWNVTMIIGNTSNLAGAIISILMDVQSVPDTLAYRFFLGFGSMLTWVSLLKYLEYNAKSYALILALKRGTPGVLRFAVGAVPMFVGFSLFGVVFFGADTSMFENFDNACATLFSLLNGDSVLLIFDSLYVTNPIVGRAYIYVFVCIFILCVFNIFVAIIQDALSSAKEDEGSDQDLDAPQLDAATVVGDSRFKAAINEAVEKSQRQLLDNILKVLDGHSPNLSITSAQATSRGPSSLAKARSMSIGDL
eukprot:c12282_g1_i4.p1 GENE.c12282_g1_i4~~c12282_g1_i4.p1  ORF type:complete len:381 (+),score=97.12 c12282_g1_i4:1184-2326(+)